MYGFNEPDGLPRLRLALIEDERAQDVVEILPVDQLRVQHLDGLDPPLVEGEALQEARTACSSNGRTAVKFSM